MDNKSQVDDILFKLWQAPYDVDGQRAVIRNMLEENDRLRNAVKKLNEKLCDRTRELNRQWEDNYNEVRFEREE